MVYHKLRLEVIGEAESWRGTPYHTAGRIKGVGVDCLTFIHAVYHAVGVMPEVEMPFYPANFMLHRSAEIYIDGLTRYATEVESPRPGDIALFKFGRCFSHAAIVIVWPKVIHAWNSMGVIHGDATRAPLVGRRVRYFSPFEGGPKCSKET